MQAIVHIHLTYPGKKDAKPSIKSLKILESTISNAIENGDLDLHIGAGVYPVETITRAESLDRTAAILSALQMAEGWIDAHREDETTGDGQNDKFVLDSVRAAIVSAQEGT